MDQCEELITEQLEPLLHDNQHDRIAAGLAIGIALVFTDTERQGDALLRQFTASGNEYTRMAGVLGLGLAHAGHHQDVEVVSEWVCEVRVTHRLLRVISSDVSPTVRRNAVVALGLLYADAPAAFVPTALLLLQSYNPYIRYAAALISGLINAGTGDAVLAEALMKLMNDNV